MTKEMVLIMAERRGKKMTKEMVLIMAERLGFDWDEQEAESFLKYNLEKGRTGNWEYAAQMWEEIRKKQVPCGNRTLRSAI